MAVRKTTLTVDEEVLEKAREILGTTGVKDTIDEALARIIRIEAFRWEVEYWKKHPTDHRQLRAEAWGE